MNDATAAANKSYLGIRNNRQPLRLNLEAKMAAGIESDSAPDAERETREVDIRTTGNTCGAHAGRRTCGGSNRYPRDPSPPDGCFYALFSLPSSFR